MNVVAEIQRINERELALGVPFEASWHQKYKSSAWVYVGGLAYELSEGDVLCVMSQFGEIEDLNLVRDGKTGKSKGFALVKYENWLSTVLAVDNMNGATLLERTVRVDHVLQYKLPKEVQDRENERQARLLESSGSENEDEAPRARGLPGHAYEGKELATPFDIAQGQNVFAAPPESEDEGKKGGKDKKKKKKAKKEKKDKKGKKDKKSKSDDATLTVEQRQAAWMEHVKRQRELRREQEARERALAGDDAATAPQPSETGWRGRLEPTEHAPPPRGPRDGDSSSFDERERKRRAGFGGIDRVR